MFTPGQKVVCIDDKIIPEWQRLMAPLMEGTTYTIRDIVRGTRGKTDEEEVAVYLHEIHNPRNPGGLEYGYNAERFAPLAPAQEETEEAYVDPPGVEEHEFVHAAD